MTIGNDCYCEELQGHVYDYTPQQAYHYNNTTSAIADYVGRTFTYGNDISLAITNLKLPTIQKPTDPDDDASSNDLDQWEQEVQEYVDRESSLRDNIMKLYFIVWAQCTEIMQLQLKAMETYNVMDRECNGLTLLITIKNMTYNVQNQKLQSQNYQYQKYIPHSLYESLCALHSLQQGSQTDATTYLNQFQNVANQVTYYEVKHIEQVAKELYPDTETLTQLEQDQVKKIAQERFLAVAFLLGSDQYRFGNLIISIQNDYLLGKNTYPQTVAKAYNLLLYWKQVPQIHGNRNKKKNRSHITCHKCGKVGHYATKCRMK